jgi:putative holliday junction resolvase
MGKVMALDWGARRMGLALSDETRTLARPLPTLHHRGDRTLVPELLRIIREEGVDTLVVGLPLHMDGRESESARRAGTLAGRLRDEIPGLHVVLWDERLSSREASALLRDRGERCGPGQKGRIDQVAAALLLQEYLDGRPR